MAVVKVAVSIPEDVFRRADREAKRLGISRSALLTQALQAFFAEREEITARLNEVYGEEPSGVDPLFLAHTAALWKNEPW